MKSMIPFLVFGTRRLRLAAAFAFTTFHLGDLATANYGFFCYISLALNFFLVSDHDVRRAWVRVLRRMPPPLRRWRARCPAAGDR